MPDGGCGLSSCRRTSCIDVRRSRCANPSRKTSQQKGERGSQALVGDRAEGFLRHGRALKHGLTNLPGRLLTSPALADDVSSPSSSYPSAGCSSAEPAYVSLDKIRAFPVSVSFRVYRVGNGQREFELVAASVM